MSKLSHIPKTKTDPQSAAMVFALIAFGIQFVLLILVDGFLLHPIPAPEGTFSLENREFLRFDLPESTAPYWDATILDSYTAAWDVKLYLVEKDGQRHLLDYRTHFVTERTALRRDILIQPDETNTYSLGWVFNRAKVEITNGRMTNCQIRDGEINPRLMMAIYTLLVVAATALETMLYSVCQGKKGYKKIGK